MLAPGTLLDGLTLADVVAFLSQNSTSKGFTISDLTRVVTPEVEFANALHEAETPTGPNGSYQNKGYTTEQWVAYLQGLIGGGSGGSGTNTYHTDSFAAGSSGQQTQTLPSTALKIVSVGVRNAGDETLNLLSSDQYTFANSVLTISPGTIIQAGSVIEYAWVDGSLSGGGGSYDDTALKARLGNTTAQDPAAPLSQVGKLSFVDVPLAADSNGNYLIPAAVAGKRFIIDGGTASSYISLELLNASSVGNCFAILVNSGTAQRVGYKAFGNLSFSNNLTIQPGECLLLLGEFVHAGGGSNGYYTARYVGKQGNSLPTIDLLDHTTDQMNAVMALTYDDNNDADPSLSPSWSLPGMWFDGKDSNGDAWRYTCGRQTYIPGSTTSGVGPCWSRITKIKP